MIADRLVQIWVANEHELARLRRLRRSYKRARAYATAPGSGTQLASACLEFVEREIRRACARLGANDREARSLLAQLARLRSRWEDPAGTDPRTGLRRRRSG
jgi:hypothetical protein